jgi:hypothetical protein
MTANESPSEGSRVKLFAAVIGGCAVVAMGAFSAAYDLHAPSSGSNLAGGGSGDSATGTSYVQPNPPAMSFDPTAMNVGATATAGAPPTTLATSFAAPTLKATPG